MSNSLWPHGLYSPWNSPGQNTGVGNRSLLQGIFPTQGSNPGLPHCRQILYQLCCNGSPRILEWVAYPFSRGSSQPRNWTGDLLDCSRILYQLSYQKSEGHKTQAPSKLREIPIAWNWRSLRQKLVLECRSQVIGPQGVNFILTRRNRIQQDSSNIPGWELNCQWPAANYKLLIKRIICWLRISGEWGGCCLRTT